MCGLKLIDQRRERTSAAWGGGRCGCPGAQLMTVLGGRQGQRPQLGSAGDPHRLGPAELPQHVDRHARPERELCGGRGARESPEPRGPHSEAFSRTT